MLAWSGVVLTNGDLQRLPTAVRLSRKCCHTLQINVFIGPGWTILIVAGAALGWPGAAGALVATILHNLSTLLVLLNFFLVIWLCGIFNKAEHSGMAKNVLLRPHTYLSLMLNNLTGCVLLCQLSDK
ncbi:hypothetical protein OIP52_000565 [Salmonella enterica]|nr:hypothetical protein [Salmonella enterica]